VKKMSQGNRSNHPKKYVRWSDWEAWLLKEWQPFKQNDFWHLKQKVNLSLWLDLLILAAVIGKLIMDFFRG